MDWPLHRWQLTQDENGLCTKSRPALIEDLIPRVDKVTESGKPLVTGVGISDVRQQGDEVVAEVGSG